MPPSKWPTEVGAPISGAPEARGPRAWAWRRGWWLLLTAPVAAVLLLGAGDSRPSGQYEASSLVVARQLAIDVEQLPALVESVFSGGSVSDRLEDAVADVTADDDAADRVDVEPVLGTIAVRVVARDGDATTAAALANAAAEVLVAELNKAGPGVGVFALQDPARPPTTRVEGGSTSWSLVVPALAGLVLAMLVLELWVAIRQPVVNGADAERLLGAELLADIALPRGVRNPDAIDPVKVIGLDALSRRLLPGPGVAAIVSGRRDAGIGRLLTVLTARVSNRRIPTRALHVSDGISADQWPSGLEAAVVDLGGAIDAPQVLPPDARIGAVVISGTPAARVRRLAAPFRPGELDGVVMIRRPSGVVGRRRHRQRRPPVAPAPFHDATAASKDAPASAARSDGAGRLRARWRS